jgi:hypothetical protein
MFARATVSTALCSALERRPRVAALRGRARERAGEMMKVMTDGFHVDWQFRLLVYGCAVVVLEVDGLLTARSRQ